MAFSFNSATLGGYLGGDPETREFKSGNKLTEFSLAVQTGYGDNEETSWFQVKCWGKAAEIAERYLRKGMPVIVNGGLVQERWEKDGQKRSRVTVKVWSAGGITMLPKGSGQGGGGGSTSPGFKTPSGADMDDEDLPF